MMTTSNVKCSTHPNEAVKAEIFHSNFCVNSKVPSDAQVQSGSLKSNCMLGSLTECL